MSSKIKLEVLSTEFGVFNVAVFYRDRLAGDMQLKFLDKPKRTRNLMRAFSKAGISVRYPQHWREKKKKR